MTPRRRDDPPNVDTGEFAPDELPEDSGVRQRLLTLKDAERAVLSNEHRRLTDMLKEARMVAMFIALASGVLGWFGGALRSPSSEANRKITEVRTEMLDSLKAVNRRMEAASERNYVVLCMIAREVIPRQAPSDCHLLRPPGHSSSYPRPDTAADATRVAAVSDMRFP